MVYKDNDEIYKDRKGEPADRAPYNPLSPHAEDPAYEPAPTHEEDRVGHGGEYDQQPYTEQQKDTSPEGDGEGEYDQKKHRDRQAGRPGPRDS